MVVFHCLHESSIDLIASKYLEIVEKVTPPIAELKISFIPVKKCILFCPEELRHTAEFIQHLELYEGIPFVIFDASFEILSVLGSETLYYCYKLINELHQLKKKVETKPIASSELSTFNLGFVPSLAQRNDNIQLATIYYKIASLFFLVGSPSSSLENYEKAIGKIDLIKYPTSEDALLKVISQESILLANIYAHVGYCLIDV